MEDHVDAVCVLEGERQHRRKIWKQNPNNHMIFRVGSCKTGLSVFPVSHKIRLGTSGLQLRALGVGREAWRQGLGTETQETPAVLPASPLQVSILDSACGRVIMAQDVEGIVWKDWMGLGL